jgi:hypothetical protein
MAARSGRRALRRATWSVGDEAIATIAGVQWHVRLVALYFESSRDGRQHWLVESSGEPLPATDDDPKPRQRRVICDCDLTRRVRPDFERFMGRVLEPVEQGAPVTEDPKHAQQLVDRALMTVLALVGEGRSLAEAVRLSRNHVLHLR